MICRDLEREIAVRFGTLVREQRIRANLRQEDLAMAAGVGRRFIVDLEGGKPSCHLGRALRVAELLEIEFPQLPPRQQYLPHFDEEEDEDNPGDDNDDGVRTDEWVRSRRQP